MPIFSPEELRRQAQIALMDTAERTQPALTDSAPPRSHMHAAIGVMGAGQLADALTSHAAIERGAHEQNPVYGDRPSLGRLLATKAAISVPSAIVLEKLYPHHPKLAQALALGIGGAGFGLAVHNARQGSQEPE